MKTQTWFHDRISCMLRSMNKKGAISMNEKCCIIIEGKIKGPSMSIYPDFILNLFKFYPNKIRIKSGKSEFLKNLDKIRNI